MLLDPKDPRGAVNFNQLSLIDAALTWFFFFQEKKNVSNIFTSSRPQSLHVKVSESKGFFFSDASLKVHCITKHSEGFSFQQSWMYWSLFIMQGSAASKVWLKSLIKRQAVLLVSALFLLTTRWQVMGSSPPTFQPFDNPHSFVNGSLLRVRDNLD